nr:MAG TPA: hypothetical protein [Caudoviricetes sp.]DAH92484.1 MAG TPA: hypothetical protein [Caudoviricetes sp.]
MFESLSLFKLSLSGIVLLVSVKSNLLVFVCLWVTRCLNPIHFSNFPFKGIVFLVSVKNNLVSF